MISFQQADRQVALHLMLKSSGTERILRYYAPNLRNYLTDRNITYILGILCFDFINNTEGYEKMKNLIPVTLPKKYAKQKWLLDERREEIGSTVPATDIMKWLYLELSAIFQSFKFFRKSKIFHLLLILFLDLSETGSFLNIVFTIVISRDLNQNDWTRIKLKL